jgi:hypothetical protein
MRTAYYRIIPIRLQNGAHPTPPTVGEPTIGGPMQGGRVRLTSDDLRTFRAARTRRERRNLRAMLHQAKLKRGSMNR